MNQNIISPIESNVNSKPELSNGQKFLFPKVDIRESENEFLLLAEMPGISPSNVQLYFEKGNLTIHGKVKPNPVVGKVLLDETHSLDYYRVFTLNDGIDVDKITADYKLGVLEVHLPRADIAKPRQIKVSSN